MRATLIKDLRALARTPACRAVTIVYALGLSIAVLYAYDLVGADRLALVRWFRAAQWILLTILTPWVVSRAASAERGDRLVELIARSTGAPRRLMAGRTAALTVFGIELLVVSWPVAAVVYQSAPVGLGALGLAYLEWLLFAGIVTIVAVHWTFADPHPLRGWVLATLSSAALAAGYLTLARSAGAAPALVLLAGSWLLAGASLGRFADRHLLYLRA
jgi:hypothetical protein